MNIGLYSYLTAAVGYGFFTFLLMFSWRQSIQAKLLVLVMFASTLWALSSASLTVGDNSQLSWALYNALEIIRYAVWYLFLIKLFAPGTRSSDSGASDDGSNSSQKLVRWSLPVTTAFAGLFLLNELFGVYDNKAFVITGHVFIALIALVILEQVYRNSPPRFRWAIKYLIIGAGSIFVFDFYLYTDGLLFRELDKSLWQARGFIHTAAVPLLAISAARSKNWSLNLFVSREIVLNSTAIIGAGLYLLLMSAAGYYLREFGGDWGHLGQVVLFSLALIILAAVLLSGKVRARIRVFLGKHFYRNKYDYRLEWLRLTEELSVIRQEGDHYADVIRPLAQIVEARSGMLWLLDDQGADGESRGYRNVASWRCIRLAEVESVDTAFIRLMEKKGFVINIKEIQQQPDEYEGLVLPEWLEKVDDPWLVIPLVQAEAMFGFILLSQPLLERSINWEDRDLIKTAARQVSSHLKILRTSAALAESKQFEVFSRLSAYMVHDLKNIAAELELVADNAKKHADNKAFLNDAFETVEHAAGDISRLLEQLRNRKARVEKTVLVDLRSLIEEVVLVKQATLPVPVFTGKSGEYMVSAEPRQLKNVLAHLIDNAQQATSDSGKVEIELRAEADRYLICIRDTGHGMDQAFIQHRLFKPFDTTKGNAGMGIGMYESQDFVRKIGGDIEVCSEPDKGTEICLNLPAVKAEAAPGK